MMDEVDAAHGIVPRYPGVTSALGCVMADMRHDGVQTLNAALEALDIDDLLARIDGLAAACQERLDSAGVASKESAKASSWTCCTWAKAIPYAWKSRAMR